MYGSRRSGSGKTLTITKRIEYLIGKHHVSPEEILVITFTKAASIEMKERFCAFVRTESRSCHIWNVSWYLLWYFKWHIG